jgi:hypothetical protein
MSRLLLINLDQIGHLHFFPRLFLHHTARTVFVLPHRVNGKHYVSATEAGVLAHNIRVVNSDFSGSFPIAECIIGYICPCVQVSSVIDAVAGDQSNDNIRIDFWSRPANR